MSGEKTEQATPKRRREARKKGQIAKSADLNAAITLLFAFLGITVFGAAMFNDLKLLFADFISSKYMSLSEDLSINFPNVYMLCLKDFFLVCGPLFAIGFLTGIVTNYLQVGFLFQPNLIAMKFDKINPFSGLKRLFSLKATVEMLKSILKILIIGIVVYNEFVVSFKQIPSLINIDLTQAALITWNVLISITWKAGLTLLIMGVFDYGYQRWEYEKSLKMSKQEIKDEYKLMEGDPKVKGKIKEAQRLIGMRRMMQEIPKADVVITNPTHFAIAIQYDEKKNKAPVVIAKGQDLIALKIKEQAKIYNINIVENKPLAQTLFKTTEIGDAIPEDLYQAVAEILAFVYQLRQKA
ncbi:MAG: flagellar biosynthesis protein FlhB [Hyphomonadaceae bacterium]|nr:flagellar biosynthesis protein FlhB [Clostridia bacterium]